MLDQLVFELRRRTIGLNWIVGEDWEPTKLEAEYRGHTFAELLAKEPRHQPRIMTPAPDIPNDVSGQYPLDILYAWNCEFRRSPNDLQKIAPITVTAALGPAENSLLYLLFEALAEPFPCILLREGAQWLLANVNIGSVAEELGSLVTKLE